MITKELLKNFEERFKNDKASTVVANAIAKSGIEDSSFNNDVLRFHNFKFSDSVKKSGNYKSKKIRTLLDVCIL